jgi:micrococcal nuclease
MRLICMKTRPFLLLLILGLCSSCAHNKTLKGLVVGVSDGDTITVLKRKTPYKVRLDGIDCPEKKQPFGKQAKEFTSQMVFGKKVKVKVTGIDRYKRTLGTVFTPDGTNLNESLIINGLAWHYVRYSKDTHLKKLEKVSEKVSSLDIGLESSFNRLCHSSQL